MDSGSHQCHYVNFTVIEKRTGELERISPEVLEGLPDRVFIGVGVSVECRRLCCFKCSEESHVCSKWETKKEPLCKKKHQMQRRTSRNKDGGNFRGKEYSHIRRNGFYSSEITKKGSYPTLSTLDKNIKN